VVTARLGRQQTRIRMRRKNHRQTQRRARHVPIRRGHSIPRRAFAAAAASSDPTFGVMNASGGIYWRSAPDWNTPVAIAGNGFYPGTVIAVHCYQAGAANVPGSSDYMWEQASWYAGPGSGSGWINEHFINDGQPINQPSPGVPPCSNPAANGGVPETAGGAANTWTNYQNAGGTQGPTISGGATTYIACKLHGFQVPDGNTWWYQIASPPWNNAYYVSADAFYNNGQTSGSLRGTPFYDPAVPDCATNGGSGTGGVNETVGGNANTWTNYTNAGGTQGPTIPAGTTVSITCKVTGFQVADGNTWWYQVGSGPWSNSFYVSADAFYNNGQTSGSLRGTPFVDYNVPDCTPGGNANGTGSSGARGATEFTGGPAATWSNYTNAGGVSGGTIPQGTPVSITCRVQGFRVADGNTWWYLIASPPWAEYFVSADAFYNNGATSGGLSGTPFYDPAVPVCTGSTEALLYSTAVATGHSAVHSPNCTYGLYPVNCASGDFWHSFTDVSIPGRGPGLTQTRTYNSLAPDTQGLFGYGWSSSYDQHLLFTSPTRSDGSIVIVLEDGSQIAATPNGNGGYTTPPQTDSSFQSNGDGTYTLTLHHLTLERFSGQGQLLSIADLNGNQTTLGYDGSGHLSTVTDAAGRALTFAVGGNGLVSSVSDPLGRTTTYSYDSSGQLASVSDALGRTWSFTYDAGHRMLTMTDPRGGTVTNTYDSDTGRITKQVDPAGLATTFAYTGDNYGPNGGTTTITDPHGNVRLEQYANGFLMQVTRAPATPEQATTTNTYDPTSYGQTSSTDPRSHTTYHTYDATGHVLTTTDALGQQTTYTYNGLGELATTTTPLGHVTTKTYDANGNLLSTTDPLGGQTAYTYGDSSHPGDVTSVTDPDGRVTRMTYDTNGDLATKSVAPSGSEADTTAFVYDAVGEVVCEALPNATAAGVSCPAAGASRSADTITTAYDAGGQVVSVADANGHTTAYAYDGDGNRTRVTDASGNVTTSAFDGDNRITAKTVGAGTPAAATTSYVYDVAAGSSGCPSAAGVVYCATRTDPNGQTTVDAFDGQDNRLEDLAPGGRTTQYTYDLAGNNLTKVDAQGRTTTRGYDADNHLTSVAYSDGATPAVSYGYDADGHRVAMTDGTGTTSYTYDANGRLTAVTNGAGQTTTYGYDHAGNVVTLGYPNGKIVSRTYDGAGRLAYSSDWLGNTSGFSYDPDGNLVSTKYPNGTTVKTTYDPADAITASSIVSSKGTLASITYTRNADDLVASETDRGALTGTTKYSYDPRNELTAAAKAQFGYDTAGNLTTNSGTQQTFDNADQLAAAKSSVGTTTYAYDRAGDRTAATPPWGFPQKFTYNQAAQLSSISQAPAAPGVSSITPASGATAGGTTLTIKGSGFSGATTVTVGGVAATNVTVSSDSQLTAVTPAGSPGSGDVVVTAPGGTSPGVPADRFTYLAVPAITGLAPAAGSTAGGTAVTLTGGGFTGATGVFFGSVAATAFTVNSDSQIIATTPAGIGTVAVTVKTPRKTSAAVAASHFVFADGPVVTKLQPAVGPNAGTNTVTLSGSGFTGATQVLFGSTPATNLNVVSDNKLTVTSPAGSGQTPVYVVTSAGTSPKSSATTYGFQAVPTVTGLVPAAGSALGGTTVTITGTGLANVSGVSFGNAAAAFKSISSSSLLAIAPPGNGIADITVTTAAGTTTQVAADRFTYAAAPTGFAYNGDGLRMSESTAGSTIQFAWDSTPSVPELVSDGNASYVYGPGGLPIEQIDSSGNPTYFFHDAIGSARALVSGTGAIGATYAYSPYGLLQKVTGTASTPLLYGQGYSDQAVGLIYLVNRYYDPATGQFLTSDPALDETNQAYLYASNDPVNAVDPSGLGFCLLGHNPNGSCRGAGPARGVGNVAGKASLVTGAVALGIGIGVVTVGTGGTDLVALAATGTFLGATSVVLGNVSTAASCVGGAWFDCGYGTVTGGIGHYIPHGIGEDAYGVATDLLGTALNAAIGGPGSVSPGRGVAGGIGTGCYLQSSYSAAQRLQATVPGSFLQGTVSGGYLQG
jgi:RHS repeat-associated protein